MERRKYILKSTPTEDQKVIIERMSKKKHFICVEKTGKGKSLDILASFIKLYNNNKLDTLLVLTPKNAHDKRVWKSEVSKHTNMLSIDIETLYSKAGTNPEKIYKWVEKYSVIYCKHSSIYNLDEVMKIIQRCTRCAVLWDEVHRLKNPVSRLTLSNKLMASNAYARWALTASPVSKDLKDCYNLVNFIYPWYLGTYDQFTKEFCKMTKKIIGRLPGGGLKKVDEIAGVLNERALQIKLYPVVITGSSQFDLKWDYIDYEMAPNEARLYHKLAAGVFAPALDGCETAEEWFKRVMGEPVDEQYQVKEVSRHSSRFLYLQFAADGIIADNGDIGTVHGEKFSKALTLLQSIYDKGESAIMYFDYYASLKAMEKFISSRIDFKIIKTTGQNALTEGMIDEAKVLRKPHLILSTRAGSESSSFYYINHVILFHIPTTPEPFTQIVGRITRINTLFPDDLNVHVFRSPNIDLYKLGVVCHKAAQAEIIVAEEKNIPDFYKEQFKEADVLQLCKKYLLWHQTKSDRVSMNLI